MPHDISSIAGNNIESHDFEERADYLPDDFIIGKTAKDEHFSNIQSKIFQVGAKLLIGPRGTGKTHHMRLAYLICAKDDKKPLALYISFNHYLRLETYLTESSNAVSVFHAWVLSKILRECLKVLDHPPEHPELSLDNLQSFIEAVEKQQYNSAHDELVYAISIEKTIYYIEKATTAKGRKRAVLLLDDAALTLTPAYMIEFFEVFRSLKTAHISPKASVYPGSTQYGPRFHLGHDAEPVNVWLSVENPKYLSFMTALTDNRFEADLNIPMEVLDLLKYAAFGNPRSYIMMVRDYEQRESSTAQSGFNKVISERKGFIIDEYMSLSQKLPQYGGIISTGHEFINRIISLLKTLNYEKLDIAADAFEKTITVGLANIPVKAERMIRFLIEAGLLYEADPVSHGPERKLRRFIPHTVMLFEARVLTKSRGFNASVLLNRMKSRSSKHPARPSLERLLPASDLVLLELDLPPCTSCGASRMAEKQKFCHNCGKTLVDESAFKRCMETELNQLPLTAFQKKSIRDYTNFQTVGDVIKSQDPANELQKAHRVKAARAYDIYTRVNRWVDEFLV